MIRENVVRINERISAACSKIKREPRQIVIVAVSKNRSVEEIKEAIEAGITDIGENKVQEALLKFNVLQASQYAGRIKWHMVGHLQSNKAKDAVSIFDLIQSVDSLHLAQELNKQAAKLNKVQDILIEIKTSPEATKFGLKPEETIEVTEKISKLANVRINGLMTIAPLLGDAEKARPYFKLLRELRDGLGSKLKTQDSELILSMGMTDDFEIAIEEGADMVRIGRAIFE